MPANALIQIISPIDTVFQGSVILSSQHNENVKISISCEGFANFDTIFISDRDQNFVFRLAERSGNITFYVFDEGGIEVKKMDININGEQITEKSGQCFSLPSGKYNISLSKKVSNEEIFIVEEFPLTVIPGSVKKDTLTAKLKGVY